MAILNGNPNYKNGIEIVVATQTTEKRLNMKKESTMKVAALWIVSFAVVVVVIAFSSCLIAAQVLSHENEGSLSAVSWAGSGSGDPTPNPPNPPPPPPPDKPPGRG